MQEPKSTPSSSSSSSVIPSVEQKDDNKVEGVVVGRERLKRHREEIAGHVRIPEKWGHEKMMKNWIHGFSSTTFHGDDDAFMAPPHTIILAARDALVADSRKARTSSSQSQRLRIHTTC